MTEETRITTIAAPDESAIRPQVTELAALTGFRVVDQTTCEQARSYVGAVDAVLAKAESIYKDPVGLAFKLHRTLTGGWNALKAPLETVKVHLRKEVANYLAEQERQRAALEAKLRAEQEAARKKAEEEVAAALPWEVDDLPTPTHTQSISIPAAPPIAGVQPRNKPWEGRVVDMLAFCRAAVKRAEVGDKSLLEALTIDPKWLQLQARNKKEMLSQLVPGVEAYRETTVAFR
jgi:hypothetical protein